MNTSLEIRKNWLSIVLVVIVIIMAIEIVYLINQNRRLRSIIENPQRHYQTLQPDETVPPLSAQDENGNEIALHYSPDQPYRVLLWFSPTCPSCDENFLYWNDLYRDYDSDRIRLLGICSDDPSEAREAVEEYGLSFPVICLDDQAAIDAYKGHTVPLTMLISPDGAIRKVWPGPLMKGDRQSIITKLTQLSAHLAERR